MAAINGVFPRPPTGKRPDYLPKRRPGVRYRRPDSLAPIRHSIISEYGDERSSSEPDGQPGGEAMTESHTHDQYLQDRQAVIRPTKPPKKKHTCGSKSGGRSLCLNKADDDCTVMMAKTLIEEEEIFNTECANQMEHLIEKRCQALAANHEVHIDKDYESQAATYTEQTDTDEDDKKVTEEMELESDENEDGDYETHTESKHKDLVKLLNDNDDANVDNNGVGEITSACASSNVVQRSVSVQVPDENIDMDVVHVVPCQYYEREEHMAIDPVNDELCTPKSKTSMATSITESLFHEQSNDFDEMNVETFETHDRDHPMHHASKPMDWDNVSISAIVELEMMKEDLEEGIVENLEKLGRLLNLETRHNGKDHSVMEREVAALVSVLKEEMDASDDEEDDYHRMSDLDEEYDYWKVNSGVLIWNPPLRVDEISDVPNRKVSLCPTLESIKEEDNGEADMDDDEDNGEDETKAQNQMTDAELKKREELKELETIPSKDVKCTMSTEHTSQGLATEVDEYADMLSSVIISNALPVKNESSNSEMANLTVTSGESFGSGSSETIYKRKESITQSEMEITATPSPEHAAVNRSTDLTEPHIEMYSDTTSHDYTAKQTVNRLSSSDSQFSSTDDSATSTGSTVTVLVPAESNTCNISVILTSPSDEKLSVTAEPSEKTEVHSVPTLNSTSIAANENEREVASAPTLMSSSMQPKPVSTCESKNAKKRKIATKREQEMDGDDTHSKAGEAVYTSTESEACNTEYVENFTKKVTWSDLPFTSTGSTVTMLVPAESNSCNISIILTSPSDENPGVTAEPSEKTEVHSVPTLSSTPMRPDAADKRQIVSAPTLISSATQLKRVSSHEQKSAKMIKENKELHTAPGAFLSSVTANDTLDGGDITAANLNKMDDNDNDDDDDNEMVFHAKSGEAVYISPVISSTGLGQMREKYTVEVAEENRAGDSVTRNATERKAPRSLRAFSRCDVKGSNDLHCERSRAKRLEPFRAASKPDTTSKEGKILLRHIRNPDRSKINFDELCTLNNAGTDITPERLAKTEERYYPRDGQKEQNRPTCDGEHLKRGSCKSASKAQNHLSSLSDTCVHTCDGKTLKRRSHKSASEYTCKHEAESVAKRKRKSSKNNPQSKVAAVGRTSANRKSGNVDATRSCNAEIYTRNDKVSAKSPCKLEKSSNQLVTGTYDSGCNRQSGFLPPIHQTSLSTPSLTSRNHDMMTQSSREDQKTGKNISHIYTVAADECEYEADCVGKKMRSSNNSLSSKVAAGNSTNKRRVNATSCSSVDKIQSCKAETDTGRPSQVVERNNKQLNNSLSATKESVHECSKSELSSGFLPSYNYRRQSSFPILGVAHRSSMSKVSSEERKPLQSIASAEQTSEERSPSNYETNKSAIIRCSSDANTSSKYRQAVLKAKSSIGGSVLPSKLSKVKSSVPSFTHGDLTQMATSSEEMKTSRADTLGMSRENAKPNSVVASERPVSVCEKTSRAAMLGLRSKSFTSKVTGTVDLEKMIATKVNLYKERAERNSLKGIEYSQQSWHKECEMISEQNSRQKMNSVSVHELSKKPSRSLSDVKLPPLTQPETISLPKIPLTSDGQGLDGTAWIRANRDIILRQASRKKADHLNSIAKTGCSMSDKGFDKLPQIVKQENQSLPEMPRGSSWY